MFDMSITLKPRIEKIKDVEIRSVATGQTAVARMQPIHKPFDDPRVRKAFRLALDTDKLLQIAHGGLGAPAEHHHVAPIHPEYAKLPFMKQDIAGAKKLLAVAFVVREGLTKRNLAAQRPGEAFEGGVLGHLGLSSPS